MKQAEDNYTRDLIDNQNEQTAKLQKITALVEHFATIIYNLKQEMSALEVAGLKYATPHYRAGKYLYMIHPQKDGERVREYVGADPARIKEAMEAINRAHRYDQLSRELQQQQGRIDGISYHLGEAIRAAGRTPLTW